MGKECGARFSRRLWGGSNTSPLKTTVWEAYVMWPGFDSRPRRHTWVEFVVGSRPCSKSFSPGTPVFLTLQKPTFPNSNSTWKQWIKSHFVDSTIIPIYFIYFIVRGGLVTTLKNCPFRCRLKTSFKF